MQALNLRPEPVAPQIQSAEPRTSQGVSRSSQDESSFEVALRKAQKELDEASSSDTKVETEQKSTQPTTEGKNETNSHEKEQNLVAKEDLNSEEKLALEVKNLFENQELSSEVKLGDFTIELEDLRQFRALINPNKLKLDSEEKMLSIPFEDICLSTNCK